MNGRIFTAAFRRKLKRMVRVTAHVEAPMLALKISPIFSIIGAALVLLKIERYSYLTFTLVLLLAVASGAILSYCMPKVVLWPMRLLTLEPKDLIALFRRLRQKK